MATDLKQVKKLVSELIEEFIPLAREFELAIVNPREHPSNEAIELFAKQNPTSAIQDLIGISDVQTAELFRPANAFFRNQIESRQRLVPTFNNFRLAYSTAVHNKDVEAQGKAQSDLSKTHDFCVLAHRDLLVFVAILIQIEKGIDALIAKGVK